MLFFARDRARPGVNGGLDASDDHRDFLHNILGSHICSGKNATCWLESLVNNGVDIDFRRQCSVLQGQDDGLTCNLNWVWHVVLHGLSGGSATIFERTFGKAVVGSTLTLGEGAAGDGWQNIVVKELDDDWCGHIVDKVQLIGAIRLVGELDLWALLVHKRSENHIEVENDITDGSW